RLGFKPVGRDFPVFLHPETHEEHALARTERKSGRGYKGFTVHAAPEVTLEDDLKRRDLTINAMAKAEDGTLIDPFGGRRELKEAEVNALCERLRAPGEERELALLACRCRPALRAAHSASPQALLELLKRADAFRRPERFKDLLEVAGFADPAVDVARLRRALEAAAAVDAGAIAAKAGSQSEIPSLVDAARVHAIARAL